MNYDGQAFDSRQSVLFNKYSTCIRVKHAMQNLYHYYEMRESPEFMEGLFLGSTALLISLVDQGGFKYYFRFTRIKILLF